MLKTCDAFEADDGVGRHLLKLAAYAPVPLVIMKAWESLQYNPMIPAQAKIIKEANNVVWLQRAKELDEWLQEKKGLSMEKRRSYGLVDLLPSIVWQPLVKPKADQRKDIGLPRFLRDAFETTAFVMRHNDAPVTTAEVAEQCQGIYSRKTIRNALNSLRHDGFASAVSESNGHLLWLLTKQGEAYVDRLLQRSRN